MGVHALSKRGVHAVKIGKSQKRKKSALLGQTLNMIRLGKPTPGSGIHRRFIPPV
jgi:hypothetical protein